jgi:hypothetical protein
MSTQAESRIKEIIIEEGELTVSLVDEGDKEIAKETFYDYNEAISSINEYEQSLHVFY